MQLFSFSHYVPTVTNRGIFVNLLGALQIQLCGQRLNNNIIQDFQMCPKIDDYPLSLRTSYTLLHCIVQVTDRARKIN